MVKPLDIFARVWAALLVAAVFLKPEISYWGLLGAFVLTVFSILYSLIFREREGHGTIQVFRNGDENRRINLELDLTPEEMERLNRVVFDVDVRAENT